MDIEDLKQFQQALFAKCIDLAKTKGRDYSGVHSDTFYNLRACERSSICSAEEGILIRLSDKLSRLTSFIKQGKVINEPIEDTVLDIINYSSYILAIIKEKQLK